MKFYEVQPALEAGKKIRRKSMYENIVGISLSKCLRNVYVEVYTDGSEGIWETDSHSLRADDWEIIEDLPKATIHPENRYFYECRCSAKQYVKVDDEFHVCGNCGLKVQIIPIVPKEDSNKSIIDMVVNPPDVITLDNKGKKVTYKRVGA